MKIIKQFWGNHNLHEVYLLTMYNGCMEVAVTNFGCAVVSVLFPDRTGNLKNLVLGYDNLQNYVADPFYMGCVAGRFANRIANASFSIQGKKYSLSANEKGTANHLHGGTTGFNKKVFTVKNIAYQQDACAVELQYYSKDGEEGYPGNLNLTVTYTLAANNQLKAEYRATTDRTTIVNLTNHSYFNLSGNPVNATGHELFINADYTLVSDAQYIPTGQLQAVADTDLDFGKWRLLKNALASKREGYNDYYIFNAATGSVNYQAALRHPASGVAMTVATSYPGMMLYTGDYLQKPFLSQQGICMETHLYPNSPNIAAFPQAVLTPSATYRHFTTYQFYNEEIR